MKKGRGTAGPSLRLLLLIVLCPSLFLGPDPLRRGNFLLQRCAQIEIKIPTVFITRPAVRGAGPVVHLARGRGGKKRNGRSGGAAWTLRCIVRPRRKHFSLYFLGDVAVTLRNGTFSIFSTCAVRRGQCGSAIDPGWSNLRLL